MARPIMRVLAAFILGIFFCVGVFGLFGMAMHMESMMPGCPFLSVSDSGVVCPMTLADHILGWQQLSAGEPWVTPIMLLAAFSFLLAATLIFKEQKVFAYVRRLRIKNSFLLEIFASLRVAFARGIIHSRLFA